MSADTDAADPTNDAATASGTVPATRANAPARTGVEPTSDATGGVFDRVLVVTGDGPAGRAAASAGVDLAAAHGAAVDALYVVDTVADWDIVVERRERTGEELVESVEAAGERAGVDVGKWFRYGTAHEEVLDFAAAHDVDLIVVGSARRTGLDRIVRPEQLPNRVQRGADAPVLVVGPDDA